MSVTHWLNLFQEQNHGCKGAISRLSFLLACKPLGAEIMSIVSPLHHLPKCQAHSNNLTFNIKKVTVREPVTILNPLCINSFSSHHKPRMDVVLFSPTYRYNRHGEIKMLRLHSGKQDLNPAVQIGSLYSSSICFTASRFNESMPF